MNTVAGILLGLLLIGTLLAYMRGGGAGVRSYWHAKLIGR